MTPGDALIIILVVLLCVLVGVEIVWDGRKK